jgi:hypothetical protein
MVDPFNSILLSNERNELPRDITAWMNLKYIILHEKPASKDYILCDCIHMTF